MRGYLINCRGSHDLCLFRTFFKEDAIAGQARNDEKYSPPPWGGLGRGFDGEGSLFKG